MEVFGKITTFEGSKKYKVFVFASKLFGYLNSSYMNELAEIPTPL